MPREQFFISHATADDAFVTDLRLALEGLGHAVWMDSRNLRGGDVLDAEIEAAIGDARSFIVVLSTQTVNSPWVKKEINTALRVQAERGEEYRVLPLLLPGMKPAALGMWFCRMDSLLCYRQYLPLKSQIENHQKRGFYQFQLL